MNYSRTVLWLGLLLIVLNLAKDWSVVKSTIFTTSSTSQASSSSPNYSPLSPLSNPFSWLIPGISGGLISNVEPTSPSTTTPNTVAV